MTKVNKFMFGALLAAASGAAFALPASAQVSGVAIADPASAILSAKAFGAANDTIRTTYKAQIDQVAARRTAMQNEIKTLATPLDTNKDGQLSQQEIDAAAAAKNPAIEKLRTAQSTAENDIARLQAPLVRAQAFAIEQVMQNYGNALNAVVTAKKVSLVLSSGAVEFAQPTVDITGDIKNEIDRVLPTVSVAPPANWQPSQQSLQLLQQYQQLVAQQAMQQQQQQQAAPAAPAAGAPTAPKPATPKPAPQGR